MIRSSLNNDLVESTDSADESEMPAGEMAPLFLFLASSLNVELVYIILTCVTKFICNERGSLIS